MEQPSSWFKPTDDRSMMSRGEPLNRGALASLRALGFLVASLALTVGAWSGTASAQSFSCTQNSETHCTGTLVNGDPFTAVLDFNSGTASIVGTGSQPFSITNLSITDVTQTATSTSFTLSGSQNLDCNITAFSNGTFTQSGNCGLFTFAPNGPVSGVSPEANAAAIGTSQAVMRAQVQSTMRMLSDRIRAISRDIARSKAGTQPPPPPPAPPSPEQHSWGQGTNSSYTGLSAGSADRKWGVWLNGSGGYLKNDGRVAAYNGHSATVLAGIDYNFQDAWLMGFDAGYVHSDVKVKRLGGNRLSEGGVLGPYASYIINKNFAVDASFTYNRLVNRITGTTGFFTTRSRYYSNRFTGALNLLGFGDAGGFSLSGFLGYVYSLEDPAVSSTRFFVGGVPTDTRYGAVRIGGEAAYPIGNFEPYLPLTFQYETTRVRDGTSRAGGVVGAGLRYRLGDMVKAGFEVTSELRSHSLIVMPAANVRISF